MNDGNYIPLQEVLWWFAIAIIAGILFYLVVR